MLVLYCLGAYSILCGFLLFVLLVGQSPTWRGTVIGKANVILRNVPENALYFSCLLRSAFNKQAAADRAKSAEHYCMDSPNPIIQLFYVFLVASALAVFFTSIAPQLPTTADLAIVIAVCVISISCYLLAWLVDPGTVETQCSTANTNTNTDNNNNRKNVLTKCSNPQKTCRFGYDGVHYAPDHDCSTCNVVKPARSKHCRICGRCVRRFDHHCPWINTDVGENNLRWFHAFLVSHVVMSTIVAYWSGWVLYNYIEKEKLWFARYARSRGVTNAAQINELRPSWWVVILYAMSQNSAAAGLSFFAGLVAILLAGFWWMNFLHVLRNETTNEQHKKEDLIDLIKKEENRRSERQLLRQQQQVDGELLSAADDHEDGDDGDDDDAGEPVSCGLKPGESKFLTMKMIQESREFYGGGTYFRNVVEAFVPSSQPACEKARVVKIEENNNAKKLRKNDEKNKKKK